MRELLANNIHEKISTSTNKKTSDFSLANMFREQDLYRKMYKDNLKKEEEERKYVDEILADLNIPKILSNKQNKEEKNHSKKLKFEDINSNKEKLLEYSKLADLAYIELKTDKNKSGNDKYSFQNLKLDPLVYQNIKTIVSGNVIDETKIISLTKEEKELYEYIQDGLKNDNNKENLVNKPTLEENRFLSSLGLNEQNLAENEEKYRSELTDVIPASVHSQKYSKTRYLANTFFRNQLKESKENFETLKQDFEILDYFPNEQKGENGESGFGAVLLEKGGKKFIAIRGTEITDFGDLKEDGKLLIGKFPDKQARDLVNFIDRTIKSGEEFSIVGHSLGGALSQIATSIYADQVKETYTFNSPGVKNIKVSEEDKLKIAKFRNFEYNKEKAREKITNVRGDSGIKPVADLGEDLGNYEIVFKNLFSHLITDTILYIEKLDNNSEELKIIKIKKIREKNPKSKK